MFAKTCRVLPGQKGLKVVKKLLPYDGGRGGGWGVPGGSVVKNPPVKARDAGEAVPSLRREDPLEKGRVIHSSILPWRIPRTEETDGLRSMGSQRVGHGQSD